MTLIDEVGAMTVDSSGRTLLVGLKNDTPSIGHVAIARYLPNGNPDTSFSGDGRADLAAAAISFRAAAIRVLTDGTVVIAGERFGLNITDQSTARSMLIARLSTTGVPEAGFGSGGLLVLPSALYGLGRAAIGPDETAIMTAFDGPGPTGRNHHVVSPTGTVSVLETIDQSSLGECFNSSQQPPMGPFLFVTATEVVYTADSEIPTASCPGGDEPGLFVVRASLTSNNLWDKRFPTAYATGNPVVVGADVVIRINSISGDALLRLTANDGQNVASWGTDSQVPLILPANVPVSPFPKFSQMETLIGGGFSISEVHLSESGDEVATALSTLTPAGLLDADTPQVILQETNADAYATVAATPDGGVVWATKFDDEPTVLRRYKPGVPPTTTVPVTTVPVTTVPVTTEPVTTVPVTTLPPPASEPDAETLTPARLLDTRADGVTVDGQSAGGPRPVAGSVTTVRIAGRGGVPADGPGFATLYPCTPTPPNASNINFLAGAFVANSATAKLDANGDVCIYTLTGADLLIDVSGFVAPARG